MPFDQVRSLLFTPAADEGKLRRGLNAGADAVIWDLEDAVAASEKRSARARVVSLLEEDAKAPCLRFVRVNGHGTTE
ncbi:MAG TPA: aldolase/citrate lyase family protein, partial [Gaiellaceae bacterium]|nr:aldolase/citrate lyase family protein [Gaiellaceae bacterium]